MNLQNKSAIVTGSTKGIGLAVAEALVAAGTNVLISSRHEKEISTTVDRLAGTTSSRVAGKVCDVQRAEEARDLVGFAVSELGGLDILINNAGVGIFQSVEEMTPERWRKVIGTNLDSLFYTCHYAIPEMRKRGEGFVVNIGSLAGKNAFPTGAAYNASKFGLVGFSEALMQEVRHDDIQVAYVMPGSVDTWFGGKPPVGEDSWKLSARDIAEIVVETLSRAPRCLTSRIEVRPSKPPKK
jgi:NAD(P)-dependent dehydrogenase (short-subunit alcohol dehydrogenase family)